MSTKIKKLKLLKSLLEGDTSALVDPLIDLETKVEEMAQTDWTGAPGKDGYTPVKNVDYFDGKDGESIKGDKGDDGVSPDPKEIAKLVLAKIPKPKDGKDGKDADPAQIIQEVVKQVPVDTPEKIRDKLLILKKEDRLDASAIKGLLQPQDFVDYFEKLDQGVKNRVVGSNFVNKKGPVDQRWHGGGSSILLQTDGVDNPDQSVLNLIAGTNITLTPDANGGVTIDAGSGGGESLAQTLAIGNVTGGNDIVLSTGDIIVGQTSAQMSDSGLTNYYFAGPNYLFQQFIDSGSGDTDFLLQGGGTQIYSDTAIDIQTATGLYNFFNGNADNGTFDFTNLTGPQTYDWPDQSGTVALLSDIPAAFITAVSDTNTIDLTVTGTTLSADLRYIDSASINFSDSGAGFTGVVIPAGADTQVQFNNAGVLGASANFTFNTGTNILTVAGTGAFNDVRISNTLSLEETGAGTDLITIQAPAAIAAPYTLTLPVDDGSTSPSTTSAILLTNDGTGVLAWKQMTTITGSGTDNHIPRWDGTTALQDSGWIIDDTTNSINIAGAPGNNIGYIDAENTGTTNPVGIRARLTGTSGAGTALSGVTANGAGSIGVSGNASNTSGKTTGVQGVSASATTGSAGTSGFATSATGAVYGLFGDTNSSDNASYSVYANEHTFAGSYLDFSGAATVTAPNAGMRITADSSSNLTALDAGGNSFDLNSGYTLYFAHIAGAGGVSPVDGETVYIGNATTKSVTAGTRKTYIRRAGRLTVAEIYTYADTVAGSNENWSFYIRLNNTTDTLIATIGTTGPERIFSNTAMGIAVAAGDYIELKMVNPTWGTNPTGVQIYGYVLIQ